MKLLSGSVLVLASSVFALSPRGDFPAFVFVVAGLSLLAWGVWPELPQPVQIKVRRLRTWFQWSPKAQSVAKEEPDAQRNAS